MKFSILSVFPELYSSFVHTSLVRRAQENGHVDIDVKSFFDYVAPKQRIDVPTFGHGSGMLIRPEVVDRAVEDIEQRRGPAYKVFFSPHGKRLDQKLLQLITTKAKQRGHCMFVAGRYEGMDARVEEHYADEIVSLGDFVLMGGDLPAMICIEGMLRLIPGVVGKMESVERDSFYGPFVDYPEYAAPVTWKGVDVPSVIRSGDHGALEEWRTKNAAMRSVRNHFSWVRSHSMTDNQRDYAHSAMPDHYVVLMHDQVLVGPQKIEGTTSVTSLDIHDIARSCKTYGIKNYFVVTPLKDQQRIVTTLLEFWNSERGVQYNKTRHRAIDPVRLKSSFDSVIKSIEEKSRKKPIVVATSARDVDGVQQIHYDNQSVVWHHDRPVLLVFGTGQGLTKEFLERCDYILRPLEGFSDFKHLSVRSAAAITLDRWIGINSK